ncbi:hypothetical protein PMAYCL1PPCAC_04032, partial [Pristionchus mayeri]
AGNAIATSLQGYAMILGKIGSGILSDYIKSISYRNKIRMVTFVSLQLSAFVMIARALTIETTSILQVEFQEMCMLLVGANVGAFYKRGVLMSGPYAFSVIGNMQMFKSLSVLLEPLLFGWILANNELSEWQTFFYVHACLLTL